MSALRDKEIEAVAATADSPRPLTFGWGDVVLSEVLYWKEGDDHVFRSAEYDVIAADESPYEAIRLFIHNTVDYARLLSQADDRTAEDVELANMIMGRVVAIFEEMEREREDERPIFRRIRHGRRRRGSRWHLHPAAQI